MSHEIAGTYGLAAMDALHVAAALQIQADELITTEKPTKPMHRVREIQIVSIDISFAWVENGFLRETRFLCVTH